MQKKLEYQKKMNNRLKSAQAINISEKTEVENLFLDCIDETKKKILRKKTLSNL
jgi:hypothetical protein